MKLKQDGTPNKTTIGELKYKYNAGDLVTNRNGDRFKFIKRTNRYVWVEFLDHRSYCLAYPVTSANAVSGTLKDWYAPSVYGVGVTGLLYESDTPIYYMWKSLLNRVYGKSSYAYMDCTVSEEFLQFENFYWWYKQNEAVKGYEYQLDKDLFSSGSKVYSRETCCLLPKQVHDRLYRSQSASKAVTEHSRGFSLGTLFGQAIYNDNGRYFASRREALDFYWWCREDRVKQAACEWKKFLMPHVYQRLLDFKFKGM